ncbi:MAG: ammonium transporter, partial [Limosilactobacillus sp.]|nr:ammonium transporter [Limosilactobacillus sp.]
GWDDALGVWGVHGIGGFTGTILIGILADRTVNGIGASGHQFLIQAGGVILVAAYSFAITFILLKILGAITNIRPSDKIIQEGLDQTLLNETTYDID